MLRSVLAGILLATGLTVAAPANASPVTYRVEDLGALPGDYASVAMGINAAGDVVGWSYGPTGTRAFVYTDAAGMRALSGPAGRPVTFARAISSGGIVVGTASAGGTDIGHAVVWRNGRPRDLGTLGTGTFSEARGVNAAGAVVGTSYTNGGGLLGIHAFLSERGHGLVDLTPADDSGHAEGINDSGQIAGWRNGRAFRLTGTTFTDLGVPDGFGQSFGFAINGAGQVAGHVVSPSGNAERIFRYTDGDGLVLLGGVGEYNRAFGINAAGDVVGEGLPGSGLKEAFLYTDAGGMQGLNSLIDPAAGWFLRGAGGINDAAQIAAWASNVNGVQHAVRLTPATAGSVPAGPTQLTATLRGASVRLQWVDNATSETGYVVERSVGNDGFVVLAALDANAVGFADRNAPAGALYYRVQAFNGAGASAWSSAVTVTVSG
jgi:probable HAF family extracellular repeat protein